MREYRHVYLVNVGVNRSHKLRSPLFPDSRFEFVPIPEHNVLGERVGSPVRPVTYEQLYCYNSPRKLLSIFPQKIQDEFAQRVVHYDPNLYNLNDTHLAAFTYGDIPYDSPRASSLRSAQAGDMLFFLANLAAYDCDKAIFIPARRGLYLIGCIEIVLVLTYTPSEGLLYNPFSGDRHDIIQYTRNAHVNRLLTYPHRYMPQPFMIFEGSSHSQRFQHAVPITQHICDQCLRDKEDRLFDYSKFRSFDACVGAYTRSVRPHFKLQYQDDWQRFQALLEHIANFNAIPASLFRKETSVTLQAQSN